MLLGCIADDFTGATGLALALKSGHFGATGFFTKAPGMLR
jgi:uncharacterized protein YgbK (DUF1537 family)